MLWRSRNPQPPGRSVPLGFIHPCRPTVSNKPPSGAGWVHEVKHDGYRIQIHVREDRVLLFTSNGFDWTHRYPRVVEEARRVRLNVILDAELICADGQGHADFDALHSRRFDHEAIACAFDLLAFRGDDLRRKPLSDRKAMLRNLLSCSNGGIQYVEHIEGDGTEMFEAACKLGLEGIVSKRLNAPYKSGPCKSWIKVRNPKSSAYLRIIEGTF
jgi:bifunctional non-homologous end joining protein LigD